jgi:DNA-binding MarR family transcriptional regulator
MAQKRSKSTVRFPADASWRRNNMSRLLYTANWLFDARILEYVNENGFSGLRMAHLHVPRNLDMEGTRITELAIRAEMSKQSMGELVDQCEKMGLVERAPYAEDGRSKLIRLTSEGKRLIEVVERALASAEREMLALVGERRMEEIVFGLMAYCERRSSSARRGRTTKAISRTAGTADARRQRMGPTSN